MLHFLGIGAQKAGSTWLYSQLRAHPQVRFPAGKEVHFWDRDEPRDVAWYRGLFEQPVGSDIRNGEITPAYAILDCKSVSAVHAQFPAVRLIFLIRNPVERAWSSALMALARAEMRVEEASDQWFIDHFHSKGSLSRGDYEACIRTWESVYPKEQLLIARYESIKTEPRALLGRIAEHLGIDRTFFSTIPDHVLTRRVFSGSGQPLRSSLRPVLEQLYREKLHYLGADPGWMRATREVLGAGGTSREAGGPPGQTPEQRQLLTSSGPRSPVRVAICMPVLNRGDLATASLSSLRAKLGGIVADIHLYDNGSGAPTRASLNLVALPAPHRLTLVRLPENRGLPYVYNLFCRMIEERCLYASYAPPDIVMIADSDSYFKNPLLDLVQVLESDASIGVVSGHDSVEHASLGDYTVNIGERRLKVREKAIERGQCLVMRRDDLLACYPLPHNTNLDLDWELMQRHPQSMVNRGRRIVAVDATTHLGLYDSTWSASGVPASETEIDEVDSALARCGLLNPERLARRRTYLEAHGKNTSRARERPGASLVPSRKLPSWSVPSPRPHQLIVLGMHRSGTSALTGALARLGLYVGEEDELLAMDASNPTGYWERTDVLNLNQRLMARHLADAYQVGHLPTGSARTFDEPDLESAAEGIIRQLDSHGSWVLKEPRLCLTLPFWMRRLWAAAGIIVTRHPLEIAASLKRRDDVPLHYGIALWERYYVEALRNSHGMPRVIVSFEKLLHCPAKTFSSLVDKLSCIGFDLPSEHTGAVNNVVPSLRHHQKKPENERGLLNEQQLFLHAALEDGTALSFGPELEVSYLAREILANCPRSVDLGLVSDG